MQAFLDVEVDDVTTTGHVRVVLDRRAGRSYLQGSVREGGEVVTFEQYADLKLGFVLGSENGGPWLPDDPDFVQYPLAGIIGFLDVPRPP